VGHRNLEPVSGVRARETCDHRELERLPGRRFDELFRALQRMEVDIVAEMGNVRLM
jgi:hypothetical protein